MRHGRRLLVVVAMFTALAGMSGVAYADEFGLRAPIPDNLQHSFCFDFPIADQVSSAVAYYLYQGYHNVMAVTGYDEVYDSTCEPETDVVFRIDPRMQNWAGYTICNAGTVDGHCRSAYVYINPYNTTGPHDLVSLGCHEVGHTLGLADGPVNGDDCMATGFTWSETLDQHHIDHANSRTPSNA